MMRHRFAQMRAKTRRARGRVRRRSLLHLGLWGLALLLALRFARFTADVALRPSHGFAAYYTAARLLREGDDVSRFYDDAWFRAHVEAYTPNIGDIYRPNPPTTALLLLPLADLDYSGVRLVWTLLSLVCLIAAGGWLLQQVGLRGWWLPGFIAFALAYQPLYANVRLGQAYVLLLGLLVVAWYGYRERRAGTLGIALGLMLVFKMAGGLIWLLLMVQRRWRALAWAVATVLVTAVASLWWVGLDAWRTYLRLLPRLPTRPELAVTAYQTQFGFIHHLLSFDARWNPQPLLRAPALGTWLTGLGFAALTALSIHRAYVSEQPDLVFATFVIASVILSPLSLDYHYTLLLLPIAVLAAWVQEAASRWSWIAFGVALVLIAVDSPERWLGDAPGVWALLAYPKLYGAWLLWGLALWAAHRGADGRSRSPDGSGHAGLSRA